MQTLEPRNTQTRVKHEILSRYLDTWGGIIVGGLTKARKPSEWHFVYVDCFSSFGKYAGEKEDTYKNSNSVSEVEGSPFIGIKALDRLLDHAQQKMGVKIRVNTILIEKNKKIYEGLLENLQKAGYAPRLKKTRDFHSLDRGQIAVVNEDCTLLAKDLLAYTAHGDTWAFYLIDPRGPSGIPYDFVKSIVSQDHHDVMINFIYADLLRKTGMCIKDNPTSQEKQLIDYWSNAFDGDWWIQVARETILNEEETRNFRMALDGIPMSDMDGMPFTDEELAEVKEQTFVSAYRDVLRSMDKNLVNKLVSLKFGDKERTMFYLFLTTHDATGALALNRILNDAKFLEHELRIRLKNAKKPVPPEPPVKQMTLWTILPFEATIPEPPPTEPEREPRPTNEEIGKFIMEKFAGKRATRKDVYKELANTLYFPEEIDKALRHLRRIEQAEFTGEPRHKTVITFSTNK
jgi:three-Cys-motif partner protein